MASQIERVVTELRRRILNGELAPGDRIRELQFAPALGVSRTPLRLALSELERQGLLETVGKRGFQVRRVTLDEVGQAIDVRGVLEGLAVRLIAEAGLRDDTRAALQACVDEGRALLSLPEPEALDTARWGEMNARFHDLLVEASDSTPLHSALEHVNKSPLAAASVLGFNGLAPALEMEFLRRAQADHEDLLDALIAREGTRAEALMREHARRSRENKRRLAKQSSPGMSPAMRLALESPPAAHTRRRNAPKAA